MNDSATPAGKLCTGRCGLVKPLTAFGCDAQKPDRLRLRCRDCTNADQADCRAAETTIVFAHYGAVCSCPGCGATDDLAIDHVNGDGAEHRRTFGVRFHALLIAEGFPDGYQTMCRPCNTSKGEGQACQLWHGDPGYQRCTGRCRLVLPLDQFSPHLTRPGGRVSRCRDCANADDRDRRAAAGATTRGPYRTRRPRAPARMGEGPGRDSHAAKS